MSEPMTDERLAAIRARCDAATPGPWIHENYELLTAWPDPDDPEADTDTGPVQVLEPTGARGIAEVEANLDFCAEARKDIPDLLSEVDRLREIVGRLDITADGQHATPHMDLWNRHFHSADGKLCPVHIAPDWDDGLIGVQEMYSTEAAATEATC